MEKSTIEKHDFSSLIESAEKSVDGKTPMRVLFVCTGNTCRSPMAAAVLNHLGKGKYKATSAGISAFFGDSISEEAEAALKNAGIPSTADNDYENHFSRLINEQMLKECDKAVAISSRHLLSLLQAFPEYADKLTVMKKDISDPYMLGAEEYEKCLSEITECIKEMFSL